MSILAKTKINESLLNQIIFENIDDKFAYGKYADFTVIIMKENRYINATKLCSKYGKQLHNWSKSDGNKELINEVNNELLHKSDPSDRTNRFINNDNPSMIVVKGGKQDKQIICGTYVHELLIPHIASWISPKFAIMVSKIVNNYLVDEYTRLLKEKDKNLKQKDDKIDELMLMMKKTDERMQEMQQMQKEARKMNKKLVDKLDDANIKLDETKEQLTETNEQLSETNYKLSHVSKKLNIAIEDRVPKPNNTEKIEDFILLKNRKKNPDFKYYAVRGQTSYVNRKANKKINEQKYKEILRINSVANSVNLWNRLKEQLNKSVEYCGNEMNLISISEQQLMDTIKNVYEKRKFVCIDNITDEISDDD